MTPKTFLGVLHDGRSSLCASLSFFEDQVNHRIFFSLLGIPFVKGGLTFVIRLFFLFTGQCALGTMHHPPTLSVSCPHFIVQFLQIVK